MATRENEQRQDGYSREDHQQSADFTLVRHQVDMGDGQVNRQSAKTRALAGFTKLADRLSVAEWGNSRHTVRFRDDFADYPPRCSFVNDMGSRPDSHASSRSTDDLAS